MPGRVFTQIAARQRSLRAWDWHPSDLGHPSDPSGLRGPNLGGARPTSRQRCADAHLEASNRTPLGERGSMSPSTGSRQARGRHLSDLRCHGRRWTENEKDDARNCSAARTDEIHPRMEELAEFLKNTSLPPSQRVARASSVPLRQQRGEGRRGGRVAAARVWEGYANRTLTIPSICYRSDSLLVETYVDSCLNDYFACASTCYTLPALDLSAVTVASRNLTCPHQKKSSRNLTYKYLGSTNLGRYARHG